MQDYLSVAHDTEHEVGKVHQDPVVCISVQTSYKQDFSTITCLFLRNRHYPAAPLFLLAGGSAYVSRIIGSNQTQKLASKS